MHCPRCQYRFTNLGKSVQRTVAVEDDSRQTEFPKRFAGLNTIYRMRVCPSCHFRTPTLELTEVDIEAIIRRGTLQTDQALPDMRLRENKRPN